MSNANDTRAKADSAPARDPFRPVTDAEWSRHASFGRRGVNLMLADRHRAWLAAMPADVGAMVDEGRRLLQELREHRRAAHDVKLWALVNLAALLALAGSAAADSVRAERAERERDAAFSELAVARDVLRPRCMKMCLEVAESDALRVRVERLEALLREAFMLRHRDVPDDLWNRAWDALTEGAQPQAPEGGAE